MSFKRTRRDLKNLERQVNELTPRGSFGILTGRTTAGVTRRPLTINQVNTTTNNKAGAARWA